MRAGRPRSRRRQPVATGRATKRLLPSRSTRTSTLRWPFFLAPAMSCGTSSGFATAERPTATRRSPARSPWFAAGLFCGTSMMTAPFAPSDSENCLRRSGVNLASFTPNASTEGGDFLGDRLNAGADPAGLDFAGRLQLLDDRLRHRRWDRKADADRAARGRIDRRVDADDLAGEVKHRPAGIAAVYRGVGLEIIV